jgi:hypothetical protein
MEDAFWGESARMSDLESTTCKGNWVAARHHYVSERWGQPGMRAVAERLEPRFREAFLSPPLPFVWKPLAYVAHIDHGIFSGPMERDLGQMRAFGEFISRHDLNALYRMFFKVGTPSFILKRANVIFCQYIRGGTLEPTVGSTSATIAMHDIVLPYYLCEHGIPGWLQAAMQVAGARDATVQQSRCAHRGDSHCVLEVEWR